MKKALILVVSSQKPPYLEMINTSLSTWDSFNIEGIETIYYCGQPVKQNTDKIIYFNWKEGYNTMGYKMLDAFDWALNNKEFDYIARVNSSCYVDKKQLIKHIQSLENSNVFAGVEIKDKKNWLWGGMQFILSKDIVKKVVENKDKWNHSLMEDMALSHLIYDLGMSYTEGKGCSIDKTNGQWRLMPYGEGEAFNFNDFKEVKRLNHFFYRVKQDGERHVDKWIMEQLFNVLS